MKKVCYVPASFSLAVSKLNFRPCSNQMKSYLQIYFVVDCAQIIPLPHNTLMQAIEWYFLMLECSIDQCSISQCANQFAYPYLSIEMLSGWTLSKP